MEITSKGTITKLSLIIIMVSVSYFSFGQTPMSEADLPKSETENILDITDEEMIVFLNRNLKPIQVDDNNEKHVEVFVLTGAFTQGKAVSIDLGTLGVKVDSMMTNNIIHIIKKDYSGFLSKKGKTVDHEFSYIFNFDVDGNQVSNYMTAMTSPLRKNWQSYYKITN